MRGLYVSQNSSLWTKQLPLLSYLFFCLCLCKCVEGWSGGLCVSYNCFRMNQDICMVYECKDGYGIQLFSNVWTSFKIAIRARAFIVDWWIVREFSSVSKTPNVTFASKCLFTFLRFFFSHFFFDFIKYSK